MKCHAKKVYLVVTHGILSGSALDDIEQCAAIHGVSYPCLSSVGLILYKVICDKYVPAARRCGTALQKVGGY